LAPGITYWLSKTKLYYSAQFVRCHSLTLIYYVWCVRYSSQAALVSQSHYARFRRFLSMPVSIGTTDADFRDGWSMQRHFWTVPVLFGR